MSIQTKRSKSVRDETPILAAPVAFKGKVPKLPPDRNYLDMDTVSHPRLEGLQERVTRVVTTIEHMAARNQLAIDKCGDRKEASKHAYRAAERIRMACEKMSGALGNAMEFERIRGTGGTGAGEVFANAARDLADVKRYLYPFDYRVVMMIAGEGITLDETTKAVFGPTANRGDKEDTSRALRNGLKRIADFWWGTVDQHESYRPSTVTWRTFDSRHVNIAAGLVEQGNVAHATGRRVFRSR